MKQNPPLLRIIKMVCYVPHLDKNMKHCLLLILCLILAIDAAAQDDKVVVRIADNGPGIPDDEKDLIFDLFYSSGNSTGDSRRGLGIGLSLCQSVIRAHGGTISVSDNEPHGAVFTFSLSRDEVNLNE